MSKKKYPKKLVYRGQEWKIRWVKNLEDCKGLTESPIQTVTVKKTFDHGTVKRVLFHECLHVIWYTDHLAPPLWEEYNYDEDKNGFPLLEEYIVNTHSTAIFAFFLENPDIFKFIFEDLL